MSNFVQHNPLTTDNKINHKIRFGIVATIKFAKSYGIKKGSPNYSPRAKTGP